MPKHFTADNPTLEWLPISYVYCTMPVYAFTKSRQWWKEGEPEGLRIFRHTTDLRVKMELGGTTVYIYPAATSSVEDKKA